MQYLMLNFNTLIFTNNTLSILSNITKQMITIMSIFKFITS